MSEGAAATGAPTGRLFRSLRADGDAASGAVPALSLDQAVGLKTVTLGDGGFGAAAPVVPPSPAEDAFLDDPVADAALAGASPAGASPVGVGAAGVAAAGAGGAERTRHPASARRASGSSSSA